MLCEELRDRLSSGGELDGAGRDHVAVCEPCREEHAWLTALLASKPKPTADAPRFVRVRPWKTAAVAAGFILALGAGYVLGGVLDGGPPACIEKEVVKTVEVPVPAAPTDDQAAVLAIALQAIYARLVQVDWEGVEVRRVRLNPVVLKADVCPVSREAARMAGARKDIFQLLER